MSVAGLRCLDRVRPLRLIGQSRAEASKATGIPERRIRTLEDRFGSEIDGEPTRELTPSKCEAVRRDYAVGRYRRGDWRALAGAHCLTLNQTGALMTRQPGTEGFDRDEK